MPRPSHAESSRTLLAQAHIATLSTLALDPPGYPFGSLVSFAPQSDGDVFLLLSDLAEHTHNIRADGRGSLMVSQSTDRDPLANGRLTLLGDIAEVTADSEARALYLERNPAAAQYAGFKDFHFFRLFVRSVRYVGGFGRMSWVELDAFGQARPDPIAPHAAGIIQHMNDDHLNNMIELARHRAGKEASGATMTAVDRYGFDLALETAEGPVEARIDFTHTLSDISEVRAEMIELVHQARATT